jgi:hypothetical protein
LLVSGIGEAARSTLNHGSKSSLSVAASAVGMWATLFALSKRSGMSTAPLAQAFRPGLRVRRRLSPGERKPEPSGGDMPVWPSSYLITLSHNSPIPDHGAPLVNSRRWLCLKSVPRNVASIVPFGYTLPSAMVRQQLYLNRVINLIFETKCGMV